MWLKILSQHIHLQVLFSAVSVCLLANLSNAKFHHHSDNPFLTLFDGTPVDYQVPHRTQNAELSGRSELTENLCNPHHHSIIFADPKSCGTYHYCTTDPITGKTKQHTDYCPSGQSYNEEVFQCDPNVLCKDMAPKGNLCLGRRSSKYRPDPEKKLCNRAYNCVQYKGKVEPSFEYCPKGLIWDPPADGKPAVRFSERCKPGDCETGVFTTPAPPPPPPPPTAPPTGCLDKNELPEAYKCSGHQSMHATPENCSKYYQCFQNIYDPRKWCYDKFIDCNQGYTFDEQKKECVLGRCPQYPPILPPSWDCKRPGQVHTTSDSEDCKQYYVCVKCPDNRKWCYTQKECPSGHMFDNLQQKCVNTTRCPQWPKPLPEGYNCTQKGETHVNPVDCSKYYICKPFTNTEWTATEVSCPSGATFNEKEKRCTNSKCPQCPKELPTDWKCDKDGAQHVHPDDCTTYYNCTRVQNCSNIHPYWGYDLVHCPTGETFNDTSDECVKGSCPQDPPPLPPGWSCEKHGELKVDPDDCAQYYKCLHYKNRTWTYELKRCLSGQHFNDLKKICENVNRCPQLPPIAENFCKKEGDQRVNPADCTEYHICTKCPDAGWCYTVNRCSVGSYFDSKLKACREGNCSKQRSGSKTKVAYYIPIPLGVSKVWSFLRKAGVPFVG